MLNQKLKGKGNGHSSQQSWYVGNSKQTGIGWSSGHVHKARIEFVNCQNGQGWSSCLVEQSRT